MAKNKRWVAVIVIDERGDPDGTASGKTLIDERIMKKDVECHECGSKNVRIYAVAPVSKEIILFCSTKCCGRFMS